MMKYYDWQQRLAILEEIAPELTPAQQEAVKRIAKRMNEDLERCMLGLPPIVR